jgi:hypothetical protein
MIGRKKLFTLSESVLNRNPVTCAHPSQINALVVRRRVGGQISHRVNTQSASNKRIQKRSEKASSDA